MSDALCPTELDRFGVAEGKATAEAAKALEVSEWTRSRWCTQHGGMKANDVKRLRELEQEKSQLKRMVADQAPDIGMLEEVARSCAPEASADTRSGRCEAGAQREPSGGLHRNGHPATFTSIAQRR